jgi:hypothetical protein
MKNNQSSNFFGLCYIHEVKSHKQEASNFSKQQQENGPQGFNNKSKPAPAPNTNKK